MTQVPEYAQAFMNGTRSVFENWTALNLAVENGWGGPHSKTKMIEMWQCMIDMYRPTASGPNKRIGRSPELLADWLADQMEKRFYVQLDDESHAEVAEMICKLWAGALKGDYSLIKEVQGHGTSGSAKSQAQSGPPLADDAMGDDSDSDSSGYASESELHQQAD